MTDQARLSWALALSLLLHLTLLALLPVLRRLELPLAMPKSIEVDLSQLPARSAPAARPAPAEKSEPAPAQPAPVLLPERQIVAPSEAGEQRAPEKTRLLSDRDNTVREEMVRRGEPAAGTEAAAPQAAKAEPPAPKPAAPAQQRVAALPKLEQLLPKAGDLARALPPPAEKHDQPPPSRNLLAGGGGSFSLRPGSNDLLPEIRPGDLTLLNTKAELFAPFIRRVVARVFQHFSMRLNRVLARDSYGSGREYAEVEAIMSPSGKLLDARVVQRDSGTTLAVYRELLETAKPDVLFDANPPAGAEASDGNIHIILLVDLTVQSLVDPRTGKASAGCYGVLGAGLL
ncbi:MAG: hypothetical protein HY699_05935 [Deltaproteobacteria bacterium]|nr:hypothetical protein [Deltaproteobacteria bacterium]